MGVIFNIIKLSLSSLRMKRQRVESDKQPTIGSQRKSNQAPAYQNNNANGAEWSRPKLIQGQATQNNVANCAEWSNPKIKSVPTDQDCEWPNVEFKPVTATQSMCCECYEWCESINLISRKRPIKWSPSFSAFVLSRISSFAVSWRKCQRATASNGNYYPTGRTSKGKEIPTQGGVNKNQILRNLSQREDVGIYELIVRGLVASLRRTQLCARECTNRIELCVLFLVFLFVHIVANRIMLRMPCWK